MRRMLIIFFSFFAISTINAQSSDPDVYGFLRTINKWDIDNKQSNFDLVHVRIGARGNFNSKVGYRLYFDLARNSKLLKEQTEVKQSYSNLLLDAFISLKPIENLEIIFGQSKVPFSSSNLRSPFGMDKVLRPLITRVTPSIRDVGVKVSFSNNYLFKNTFSFGVFNGEGDNNFSESKNMAYSFRWMFQILEPLSIGANYYTGNLRGSTVNIYDLEFDLSVFDAAIFGEYVNRKTDLAVGTFDSKAFYVAGNYKFPINTEWIKFIKPTVRFDNYKDDNNIEISAITAGLIFSSLELLNSELKLNYEHRTIKATDDKLNTVYLLLQTRF